MVAVVIFIDHMNFVGQKENVSCWVYLPSLQTHSVFARSLVPEDIENSPKPGKKWYAGADLYWVIKDNYYFF